MMGLSGRERTQKRANTKFDDTFSGLVYNTLLWRTDRQTSADSKDRAYVTYSIAR